MYKIFFIFLYLSILYVVACTFLPKREIDSRLKFMVIFTNFDVFILDIVCNIFFVKRKIDIKLKSKFTIMFIFTSLLLSAFVNNFLIGNIILTIIICLFMNMLYKGNKLYISMVVVFIYGLFFMSNYIFMKLINKNVELQSFISVGWASFLFNFIIRLVTIFILLILASKREKIILESKYIYKFMIVNFLLAGLLVSFMLSEKYKFMYGLFFMSNYIFMKLINKNVELQSFISVGWASFLFNFIIRLVTIFILLILASKREKIILESKYIYKFMIVNFLLAGLLVSFMLSEKYKFMESKYLTTFIIIFINIILYYLLNDFIKMSTKLKIKTISEERSKNELKLWQKLKEKDTVQRKIMHDYSNTLICIKGLLEKENYEELKEYVENISVEYKLSKNFVETGNKLFDVLINTKYEKALENETTMILKLDNLSNLKISDGDFIVLISNLIDNAMEYCLNLKKSKREIFLSINNSDRLEIMIRNPLEDKICIIDNIIESSKEEENHGIGLMNIKEIILKYKGEQYIDIDEGYFTQYIEI